MKKIQIPQTEQKDYQLFRYWNNGWKFKFRGEVFALGNDSLNFKQTLKTLEEIWKKLK